MSEQFRFILAVVFASVLALVACPVQAQPLAPETQWKDPSFVRLDIDFPGNGYHASWQLFRCTCGDLMIRSELNVPGEVVHGDILLVNDRAVLLRGYGPDSQDQISFDAPALMMQLALRLLERSAPAGPSAIEQRTEVAVEDDKSFINLDSGAAVGGFPPPWSVTGSIWPEGDSQRRFDLVFTFNPGGATGADQADSKMKLVGLAEYAPSEFPAAADMSLADWELSWREENDVAAAKAAESNTLAELRQLLQAD